MAGLVSWAHLVYQGKNVIKIRVRVSVTYLLVIEFSKTWLIT
jgi:hypothetical protein